MSSDSKGIIAGVVGGVCIVAASIACAALYSERRKADEAKKRDELSGFSNALDGATLNNKKSEGAVVDPSGTVLTSYFPVINYGPIDNEEVSNYKGIALCRQQHSDCWAYAAMFAACVMGKGTRVDLEKESQFRDTIKKANNWSDSILNNAQDAVYVKAALKAMGVSNAVDGGGEGQEGDFKVDLNSYFTKKNARVLCLRTGGHWVAVLPSPDGGDTYPVFNSTHGTVGNLSYGELYLACSSSQVDSSGGKREWEVVYVK